MLRRFAVPATATVPARLAPSADWERCFRLRTDKLPHPNNREHHRCRIQNWHAERRPCRYRERPFQDSSGLRLALWRASPLTVCRQNSGSDCQLSHARPDRTGLVAREARVYLSTDCPAGTAPVVVEIMVEGHGYVIRTVKGG